MLVAGGAELGERVGDGHLVVAAHERTCESGRRAAAVKGSEAGSMCIDILTNRSRVKTLVRKTNHGHGSRLEVRFSASASRSSTRARSDLSSPSSATRHLTAARSLLPLPARFGAGVVFFCTVQSPSRASRHVALGRVFELRQFYVIALMFAG